MAKKKPASKPDIYDDSYERLNEVVPPGEGDKWFRLAPMPAPIDKFQEFSQWAYENKSSLEPDVIAILGDEVALRKLFNDVESGRRTLGAKDDFEGYLHAAILVAERAAKTGEDVSSAIDALGDTTDKASK